VTPTIPTPSSLTTRLTPIQKIRAQSLGLITEQIVIDLAGLEKATSDKERTREGNYINTSLLTLGTVIGTLVENAARNKADHVPYPNLLGFGDFL